MTMIEQEGPVEDGVPGPGRVSGRQLRELLADDTWLDELVDRAQEGGVQLTGAGGFLPEMIKAVLERGLVAELTSHVGYEVGDPVGRGTENSRNGSTPKTVSTEVGSIRLDVPRTGTGVSRRGWSQKASAASAGWTIRSSACMRVGRCT